jgi:hypothetical protein
MSTRKSISSVIMEKHSSSFFLIDLYSFLKAQIFTPSNLSVVRTSLLQQPHPPPQVVVKDVAIIEFQDLNSHAKLQIYLQINLLQLNRAKMISRVLEKLFC